MTGCEPVTPGSESRTAASKLAEEMSYSKLALFQLLLEISAFVFAAISCSSKSERFDSIDMEKIFEFGAMPRNWPSTAGDSEPMAPSPTVADCEPLPAMI